MTDESGYKNFENDFFEGDEFSEGEERPRSNTPTYIVAVVVLLAVIFLGLKFFLFYDGGTVKVSKTVDESKVERIKALDDMGEPVEAFKAMIDDSHRPKKKEPM